MTSTVTTVTTSTGARMTLAPWDITRPAPINPLFGTVTAAWDDDVTAEGGRSAR